MATSHHLGFNGAVAAVLRDERHTRGMTLEGVAERSGIPVVSVQRFLAARRAINLDVLDALCRGLDTTVIEVVAAAQSAPRRGDPDLVARIRAGMSTPMGPRAVPDLDVDEDPEREQQRG